jgi:hypothetical protein
LSLPGVGSVGTARFGDAPFSPPWPKPKSLAAAPLAIFRQALKKQRFNAAETVFIPVLYFQRALKLLAALFDKGIISIC